MLAEPRTSGKAQGGFGKGCAHLRNLLALERSCCLVLYKNEQIPELSSHCCAGSRWFHPPGNVGEGNEVLPSPAPIHTLGVQDDGKGIFCPQKIVPEGNNRNISELRELWVGDAEQRWKII